MKQYGSQKMPANTLLLIIAQFLSLLVLLVGANRPPNIVLMVLDDMGYGDLASYGHPTQEFGAIDEMAKEGISFTNVYAAATFCTPSRAALLTGRQPWRTGMYGSLAVHLSRLSVGLPHQETTIAEALKQTGYATGMVGKWHLGINKESSTDGYYLPHTHGFDYVGTILPFTLVTRCDTSQEFMRFPSPDCFLYRNRSILQQPIELQSLTDMFLTETLGFLHEHAAQQPFFFYLSWPQPHTPMYSSAKFHQSSKRGLYGDVMNEVSWAVGEVLDTIRSLDNNTLVLLVSDHGPHIEMCDWAGTTGGLKGGKGSYFEGGIKVPMIAWWPGVIPPGTHSNHLLSLMDIFPTLLSIAGAHPPTNTTLDGLSFHEILHKQTASDRQSLFFYDENSGDIVALRYKNYKLYWKLHAFSDYSWFYCYDGLPMRDYYWAASRAPRVLTEPLLFDIENDPKEESPLELEEHKELLVEIEQLLNQEKQKSLDKRAPLLERRNLDRKLVPCCNPPFCFCNYPELKDKFPMCSNSIKD